MLDYALRHREVVDGITQKRELGLRKFELSDEEWTVVEQLHAVLTVSTRVILMCSPNHGHAALGPQGRNTFLLAGDPQPGHCHTRHGSH